jgi:hypothetical protein
VHDPVGPGRRPQRGLGRALGGVTAGAPSLALLLEALGRLGEQGRVGLQSGDARPGVGELLAGGGEAAFGLGQLLCVVGLVRGAVAVVVVVPGAVQLA